MSSKMEQIIEEIEEYIDGCKFQPLSSTKIIVNKEELEELIAELRAKTPEEVKRYQKIISNKEAMKLDAYFYHKNREVYDRVKNPAVLFLRKTKYAAFPLAVLAFKRRRDSY